MKINHFIRPNAANILGRRAHTAQGTTTVTPVDAAPKRSLWGKVKDLARRVWGCVVRGAEVVEKEVVPVLITTARTLKYCSKIKQYVEEMAA